MSSDFYERMRREAQSQMDEAFREAFNKHSRGTGGYNADRFFYDEAGTVPRREEPPKVRAVIRSLARAKGLIPATDWARRVFLFNSKQPRPRGAGTIDVPCTVVH